MCSLRTERWDIDAQEVRSLCWCGDSLVDWAAGAAVYSLDGATRRRVVNYAYRFDAACASPSGEYAAIYERFGTKGIILQRGKVIREINRSFYHAHVFEYPLTLFVLPDGREMLAHCPDEYYRLEIEETDTGNRLTHRRLDKHRDFFHSRLNVNRSGTLLMSAGWIWHPRDWVSVYNIQECLEDRDKLDEDGVFDQPNPEISSAAFAGDHTLLLSSSDGELLDEDDGACPLGPNSIATYDLRSRTFGKIAASPTTIGGTMMALPRDLLVSFFECPKLISLRTGQVLHAWDDIDSGRQRSSLAGKNPAPPLACDQANNRFAVWKNERITVVQIEPDSVDH